MFSRNRDKKHYDAAEVKRAASGRWLEILTDPSLAGLDPSILDGRGHPCPNCGGDDRFQFSNMRGDGSAICRHCFTKDNGDGLAVLKWVREWKFGVQPDRSFSVALAELAAYLGIRPTVQTVSQGEGSQGQGQISQDSENSSLPFTADPPTPYSSTCLVSRDWTQQDRNWLNLGWLKKKSPITMDTLRAFTPISATYQPGQKVEYDVLGIPCRSPVAPDITTGWVLWKKDGKEFPPPAKGEKPRKMVLAKGSRSGLLCPEEMWRVICSQPPGPPSDTPSDQSFDQPPVPRQTVYFVEGPTDLMSLYQILPPDLHSTHLVLSNGAGTNENPHADWLSIVAGRNVVILRDADWPGEQGAVKWTRAVFSQPGVGEVRNPKLPFPVREDHGHDLREWITVALNASRDAFADFLALVEAAAPETEESIAGAEKVVEERRRPAAGTTESSASATTTINHHPQSAAIPPQTTGAASDLSIPGIGDLRIIVGPPKKQRRRQIAISVSASSQSSPPSSSPSRSPLAHTDRLDSDSALARAKFVKSLSEKLAASKADQKAAYTAMYAILDGKIIELAAAADQQAARKKSARVSGNGAAPQADRQQTDSQVKEDQSSGQPSSYPPADTPPHNGNPPTDQPPPTDHPTSDLPPLSNAEVFPPSPDSDSDSPTVTPLPLTTVLSSILERTNDWPRRVGPSLFVHDDTHGVAWIESQPALFGWLGRRCGLVEWYRNVGCVSRDELFHELRRTATRYLSVEELPHEPPLPGHFYTCPEPTHPTTLYNFDGTTTDYSTSPTSTPTTSTVPPGHTISLLISRFCPKTDADRQLILAMFATAFWGGRGGSRPVFVITSDAGRGIGKSKITDLLIQLCGGFVELSPNEECGEMRKRLLSPEGANKRLARLDNVKSLRFSWGEFESIITSPHISGRKMYVGEGCRPNNITWLMTLNGVSFSTDMAQRCIIIKMTKPNRSDYWEDQTVAFIDANRQALIADMLWFLRRPAGNLDHYTRWSAWEKAVVSRLQNPAAVQSVYERRANEADVEADEAEEIEHAFRQRLDEIRYNPETDRIHIPAQLANEWMCEIRREKRSTSETSAILRQFILEGRVKRLSVNPSRTYGRGFVWNGANSSVDDEKVNIDYDILDKIRTFERLEHPLKRRKSTW